MVLVDKFKSMVRDAASTVTREANSRMSDAEEKREKERLRKKLLPELSCDASHTTSRLSTLAFVARAVLGENDTLKKKIDNDTFEFAAENSLSRKTDSRKKMD